MVLSSYTQLSSYSGTYPIPHTSDFLKDHPMYSLANKKVLGKMKDKRNGMCLPSAKNVLNPDREKNIKKAKGTKKYVVQKEIGHAHYKEALFIQKIFRHEMNMLRGEEHESLACFGVRAGGVHHEIRSIRMRHL